jgi:diguanylate cyclase
MQVTGIEELRARATQIIGAVRTLRFTGGDEALSVAVSVGGSLCQLGADWAVWYSDADCALYEAKGIGGDGYRVIEGAGAPVAPA